MMTNFDHRIDRSAHTKKENAAIRFRKPSALDQGGRGGSVLTPYDQSYIYWISRVVTVNRGANNNNESLDEQYKILHDLQIYT